MDDALRPAGKAIGGDPILRLMEKDPRFNPDKRPDGSNY